ncbi:EamA family transporter [Mucilaginibacter sp.]|uniref:EamA family transporter n=1 Tax=Mucilaginibacter sp. TaxID=1882438 RepID=UPI003AFF645D
MQHKPLLQRLLLLFAFFNIYIIWGSTYLAVTFGLAGFPPFILVGLRYLVAGLILLIYAKSKGENFPPKKLLIKQAFSGILMLVGGTGMIAWAEQYITSGQAAILVATEPLWFLVLDRKRWPEYFSDKFILLGLLVGFAGILMFLKSGHLQINHSQIGLIATFVVLLSTIWWVLGSLLINSSRGKSSVMMNSSVQLLSAAIVCALIAVFTHEISGFSITQVPAKSWLALLFLIIFGSLIAYLSFVWLMTKRPLAIISTHTYINPVVAVFLGWLFANEQLLKGQLIGLLIILVGILLVNVPEYRKAAG